MLPPCEHWSQQSIQLCYSCHAGIRQGFLGYRFVPSGVNITSRFLFEYYQNKTTMVLPWIIKIYLKCWTNEKYHSAIVWLAITCGNWSDTCYIMYKNCWVERHNICRLICNSRFAMQEVDLDSQVEDNPMFRRIVIQYCSRKCVLEKMLGSNFEICLFQGRIYR